MSSGTGGNPQRVRDYFERGVFINPLSQEPPHSLMREAVKLYKDFEFGKSIDSSELTLDMWKRGILLAAGHQRTTSLEPEPVPSTTPQHSLPSQETPSPLEDVALRDENKTDFTNIRYLTKDTVFVLVTCAFGALAQGCAQESIVGANLQWPIEFGIAYRDNQSSSLRFRTTNDLLKFSFTNGVTYLAASFAGAWITDPLTFIFGRRGALFTAGLFSFMGPIGAGLCRSWPQFLLFRAFQGVGIGAKSSVIPILEGEVVPPRLRGRVLVFWQTFVATGIALTAATNWIFDGYWRLQMGIAFVSAVPLLVCCVFVSESPHWLMKKGKYVEAFRTLRKLRPTTLQAARDFHLMYAYFRLESFLFLSEDADESLPATKQPTSKYWDRFPELFSIPRNRNAVLASCSVMIAQQFSGINVFAFLATSVLEHEEYDSTANLRFNFGFGCANAIFSALTYFMIDKIGRRALLLTSLLLMTPFLFGTAAGLGKIHRAATETLIIIYTALYSPGAGVIPFMYSSEAFSMMYKEIGVSLAVAVNFGFAGLLAVGVPQWVYLKSVDPTIDQQSSASSTSAILYIFGVLCACAFLMVWFLMRTSGELESLTEMNTVFRATWLEYIRYECEEGILRYFKRPRGSKVPFGEWQSERLDRRGPIVRR